MPSCPHGLPAAYCAVCNHAVRPEPDPFRPRRKDEPAGASTGRTGSERLRDAAEVTRRARWGIYRPVTAAVCVLSPSGDLSVTAETNVASRWRKDNRATEDTLDRFLRIRR